MSGILPKIGRRAIETLDAPLNVSVVMTENLALLFLYELSRNKARLSDKLKGAESKLSLMKMVEGLAVDIADDIKLPESMIRTKDVAIEYGTNEVAMLKSAVSIAEAERSAFQKAIEVANPSFNYTSWLESVEAENKEQQKLQKQRRKFLHNVA